MPRGGGSDTKPTYGVYAPQPTGPAPTGYDNVVPGSDAGGVTPSGGPSANHAAPKKHHKKASSGGGGQDTSQFDQLMSMYEKLLNSFLNPAEDPAAQDPGGFGFEDTVLNRRVLQDDEIRSPGLYSATPQRQVMDPVTGATYPTPQAALAAGVTSWQYVPIGQSNQGLGVPVVGEVPGAA